MRLTVIVLFIHLIATLVWAGTLKDDFSDGNYNGWTPITFVEGEGQWVITDGELIVTRPFSRGCALLIGESSWKDYSVEFDATLHTKLTNWSYIAILLRFEGHGQQWRNTVMIYGFRDDIGMSVSIIAYEQPVWLHDATKIMPFEIGRRYQFKGIVSGNKYQFYLDEELVLQAKIEHFSSGKIGLAVCGTIASIDNVIITGDDVPDMNLSVTPKSKLATTWGRLRDRISERI